MCLQFCICCNQHDSGVDPRIDVTETDCHNLLKTADNPRRETIGLRVLGNFSKKSHNSSKAKRMNCSPTSLHFWSNSSYFSSSAANSAKPLFSTVFAIWFGCKRETVVTSNGWPAFHTGWIISPSLGFCRIVNLYSQKWETVERSRRPIMASEAIMTILYAIMTSNQTTPTMAWSGSISHYVESQI